MERSALSLKFVKRSLFVGGILVSLIGTGHIFMPAIGYDSVIRSNMSSEVSDHFYYLGTYAICMFLLTIGIISIYASRLNYPEVSFALSVIFSLLWTGRAILEIVYPVKLRLFFLDNPTTVLLPFISAVAFIYLFGAISYMAIRNKTHPELKKE